VLRSEAKGSEAPARSTLSERLAAKKGISLGSQDTTDPLEDSDEESSSKKTPTPARPAAKLLTAKESKKEIARQLLRVKATNKAIAKTHQWKPHAPRGSQHITYPRRVQNTDDSSDDEVSVTWEVIRCFACKLPVKHCRCVVIELG
jgi:hypothetical protein